MASQYKMICDVCGRSYKACLSCKDGLALEPWKTHTDTAEHYKVYAVLLGYNTGVYNIEDAYKKLQNIDLSDKNTFRTEVQDVIDKILAYKSNTNKESKNMVEVKPNVKYGKKFKSVETDKEKD